ncbi:MAG: hypothetical protein BWY66_02782 [bacterium ADurb.Bin374]|nr:MAG: hypothetical protein BWY66_02782 [bacterium ADurb.Bin374]
MLAPSGRTASSASSYPRSRASFSGAAEPQHPPPEEDAVPQQEPEVPSATFA